MNRTSGLSPERGGFGIRFCLSLALFLSLVPPSLELVYDPGFSLRRDGTNYDLSRVVELGWVEQDQLQLLCEVVSGERPLLLSTVLGGEAYGAVEAVNEWVLRVANRLEERGILANPELWIRDKLVKTG